MDWKTLLLAILGSSLLTGIITAMATILGNVITNRFKIKETRINHVRTAYQKLLFFLTKYSNARKFHEDIETADLVDIFSHLYFLRKDYITHFELFYETRLTLNDIEKEILENVEKNYRLESQKSDYMKDLNNYEQKIKSMVIEDFKYYEKYFKKI